MFWLAYLVFWLAYLPRSLFKKVRRLEKSTPPPVVAVVTNIRCGWTLLHVGPTLASHITGTLLNSTKAPCNTRQTLSKDQGSDADQCSHLDIVGWSQDAFFRKSCSEKCLKDLVAGESRAGLARAGVDWEVGDGFGFAHLPRQHTFDNIVHRLPTILCFTCDCSGQALRRGSVVTFLPLPFPGGKWIRASIRPSPP